jgi:D-alanyl-D-alanine carboxypeptidase/D-alanyl-D-alanine-endopeptidase (penicillin-binding protein 4)
VILEMAAQVSAKGVKRVEGHVLVDATLFREGARELGTGAVISPISVNDNIVDVTLTAGATAGTSVAIKVSPATSYVTFINQAQTGATGTQPMVRMNNDAKSPEGAHTVTISGTMPAGGPPILFAYTVPEPARFTEIVFTEALREKGVTVEARAAADVSDFAGMKMAYTDENAVADHDSPALAE